MGDVAADDDGAVQKEGIADLEAGEFLEGLGNRLGEVDLDAVLVLGHAILLGQQTPRITVHLLDEETVLGDLRLDVAVGRAGDRHADGAGSAVAGEANDADVVGKVLAAELGADAELLRGDEELVLQLDVAEGLAVLVPLGRQAVEVTGGGELDRLHAGVGRGAADDESDVIGGAGGGAEVLHLLDQVLLQLLRGEEGLGLLIEHGLVGAAATLGHEEELVVGVVGGEDVDLRREVGAGVDLLVHIQRHGLAVAQVLFGVGLVNPLADVLGVIDSGPDLLPLLGDDGGGAGVLAGGELELGGDHGVAQKGQGDAHVVAGSFGIAKDLGDLLVVRLAQEEGDILHRRVGENGQSLGIDLEHLLAGEFLHRDQLLGTGDLVVAGGVLVEGGGVLVDEFRGGHVLSPCDGMGSRQQRRFWTGGSL